MIPPAGSSGDQEFSDKPAVEEIHGSLEFLKDLFIFGGFIFAFIFNLFFLVIQRDLALQKAYLAIKHNHLMSQAELLEAISVLSSHSSTGRVGRLVLHEDDLYLIDLERQAEGEVLAKLRNLLEKKFGTDQQWERKYVQELPTSGNPYHTGGLEKSVLYYSWIIEIVSLVILSQTIRKRHVRAYVVQGLREARYFFPIAFVALLLPFWHAAALVADVNFDIWWLPAIVFGVTLLGTILLFFFARSVLQDDRLTELGLYVFISALFMQFIAIAGDPDGVYQVFSHPSVQYIRYASWFVLVAIPVIVLERTIKSRRGKTEPSPE